MSARRLETLGPLAVVREGDHPARHAVRGSVRCHELARSRTRSSTVSIGLLTSSGGAASEQPRDLASASIVSHCVWLIEWPTRTSLKAIRAAKVVVHPSVALG